MLVCITKGKHVCYYGLKVSPEDCGIEASGSSGCSLGLEVVVDACGTDSETPADWVAPLRVASMMALPSFFLNLYVWMPSFSISSVSRSKRSERVTPFRTRRSRISNNSCWRRKLVRSSLSSEDILSWDISALSVGWTVATGMGSVFWPGLKAWPVTSWKTPQSSVNWMLKSWNWVATLSGWFL